jgi:hypothetical protein
VKKTKFLSMLLATIFMVGLTLGEAGSSDKVRPQGVLLANVTRSPGSAGPPQTIALEPFYLIEEKGPKMWIERVIVTLEVGQIRLSATEFNKPEQRSRIFDILVAEPEKGPVPSMVKEALNQTLGEASVSSVQLSRSFLLF